LKAVRKTLAHPEAADEIESEVIVPTVAAAQAREVVRILAARKSDPLREDAHVLPKILAEAVMFAVMKLAAKAEARDQADVVMQGTRQREI